jgi:hypothetical protein
LSDWLRLCRDFLGFFVMPALGLSFLIAKVFA